ncbi:MAG: hypothetical protein ABSF68_04315 [Candidatus Acidiferrales bacterium]
MNESLTYALVNWVFVLTPTALTLWAWTVWIIKPPRFAPPRWRSVIAFVGLLSVSVALATALADGVCRVRSDSWATMVQRCGPGYIFASFLSDIVAIIATLVGKGRARLSTFLAGLAMPLLWYLSYGSI